jgi:hypothetical protein
MTSQEFGSPNRIKVKPLRRSTNTDTEPVRENCAGHRQGKETFFCIQPETSHKKLFAGIDCWDETEGYQDLPPDWPVTHAWRSSSGHPTLAFTITKILISDFLIIG